MRTQERKERETVAPVEPDTPMKRPTQADLGAHRLGGINLARPDCFGDDRFYLIGDQQSWENAIYMTLLRSLPSVMVRAFH